MQMKVALIGNPNAGKSTLFHTLTGISVRTGNFPGVTVTKKEGKMRGEIWTVVDLPGVYALTPYSVEESAAKAFLTSGEAQIILAVLDGAAPQRGLFLLRQLARLGIPLVAVLNRTGGEMPDAAGIEQKTGIPCVLADVRDTACRAVVSALLKRARIPNAPHGCKDCPCAEYSEIDKICNCNLQNKEDKSISRLDRIALGKHSAYPVLLFLLALTFGCALGAAGSVVSPLLETALSWLWHQIGILLFSCGLSAQAVSFITDSVLSSVGGVVCFLPSVLALFAGMAVLEDSGYLARAAVIADRPMRTIGLSGRALYPLLTGFGCTVPAVLCCRTIPDDGERKRALCMLPFLPCSAKLPVCAAVTAAFFPAVGSGVIAAAYLSVVLIGTACAAVGSRIYATKKGSFYLELPVYRRPTVRNVCRIAGRHAAEFFRRAFSVVLLATVVVALLTVWGKDLRPTENAAESLLAALSGSVAFLLRPLGLGDWRAAAALLCGEVAKESAVSVLGVLGGIPQILMTWQQAGSFLIMILLYPPCLPALHTVRKEYGWKTCLYMIIKQLAIAYFAALAFYQLICRI